MLQYFLTYLILIYLLTHSLTAFSRALLEKLTGSQLLKKFLTFYGTQRFITTFTRTATFILCNITLNLESNHQR